MSLACCVKCQRRGQREPNCDSARSNCNVVCVDCTWLCATLVAVTMCGTAEATKDHLNEHSLCYSSQLGSQAPSRDRSTRAESGLCRVSVACVSYGSTCPRHTYRDILFDICLFFRRKYINDISRYLPGLGDVMTVTQPYARSHHVGGGCSWKKNRF